MRRLKSCILALILIGGTTPLQPKAYSQYKPHVECFLEPVLVKVVNNGTYEYNEYYDTLGNKIDLQSETIYIDSDNGRWYFPYDGFKFHEDYHKFND